MKTYKIGMIGVGMYGKILLRCFAQDPRANVTWVNSASEATTKSAAQEFGIEKWTLDYRDILADPSVDAVVIATPPYLHAKQLSDALSAGNHVLVEKPLAVNRPDCRHLVVAAESGTALLAVNQTWDTGWSARIDGVGVPLLRCDLSLSASSNTAFQPVCCSGAPQIGWRASLAA